MHLSSDKLIRWAIDYYGLRRDLNDRRPVIPVKLPPKMKAFFRCLISTSPVCSYIFPSEENLELLRLLTEVDIKGNQALYLQLQAESPVFYDMLIELTDCLRLPAAFRGLIRHLTICAVTPFNPEDKLPDLPSTDDKKLEW